MAKEESAEKKKVGKQLFNDNADIKEEQPVSPIKSR
jgi:hypothetical protein